jgi:hypothetical protein
LSRFCAWTKKNPPIPYETIAPALDRLRLKFRLVAAIAALLQAPTGAAIEHARTASTEE